MKDLISDGIIQNAQKRNCFIEDLANKLYSNSITNKIVFEKIIGDILNHKKYESWKNKETLESAFLLKYCSSSCYYRLYVFLNKKIPSLTTIESSLSKELSEREKVLSDANSVNILLNRYYDDIKNELNDYLSTFTSKFKSKIKFDKYKIQICLGCDAASFTSFIKDKQSNDDNKNSNNELKTQIKHIKKQMFKNIITGEFGSNEVFHQFINDHTDFDVNHQKFFLI